MDELQTLTYEVADRVGRITLNRPERGNGLTPRLISELVGTVERADLDPDVHVILLAGSGKGFCGGYDLVESAEGMGQGAFGGEDVPPGSPLDPAVIAANHAPAGVWDPMVDYAMMGRNAQAFMTLFHAQTPVVCKVHGFCVAGGTDLALCSDLLVIAGLLWTLLRRRTAADDSPETSRTLGIAVTGAVGITVLTLIALIVTDSVAGRGLAPDRANPGDRAGGAAGELPPPARRCRAPPPCGRPRPSPSGTPPASGQ